MWIEEGFRVLKSGQWNVERTRMTDPARIERLWVALSLATLWTLTLGDAPSIASLPELPDGLRLTKDGRRRVHRVRWGRSVAIALLIVHGVVRLGERNMTLPGWLLTTMPEIPAITGVSVRVT